MLIDLFPRTHVRFACLTRLGAHLGGLARWLHLRGFAAEAIRKRIRKAPALEALLPPLGEGGLSELSQQRLLELAPRPARKNPYLSALVRSLAKYLDELSLLRHTVATPAECAVNTYLDFLAQVRGLAASTLSYHGYTVREFLAFLNFDHDPAALEALAAPRIEAFVQSVSARCGRGSIQHTVAHLRSFLRFLAGRGEVAGGLDTSIDTSRVHRDELLPKALPWETVQTFLADIDRTKAIGRRDYAMFLLMATYGLRCSEVASLGLDSVAWRAAELRVHRPKLRKALVLPLTEEVGAALVDYLRNARPAATSRAMFLGTRLPVVPLASRGVQSAFRRRVRHTAVEIPFAGAHCLRHSLALHLLQQQQPLHAIGGLLGHRNLDSTSQYLRLHADDLRVAALDLPVRTEAGQ